MQKRIIAAAMGICLACSSCFFLPQEEQLPAAPVVYNYEGSPYETVQVVRGDITDSLDLSLTYNAIREEELYFALSGELIDEVLVKQGDTVTTGTVLAELDMSDLREQLRLCENEIEQTELALSQTRENRDLAYEQQRKYLATLTAAERAMQPSASDAVVGYLDQLEQLEDALALGELKQRELLDDIAARQIVAGMDGAVSFAKTVEDGEQSDKEELMFKVSDSETSAFIGSSRVAGLFEEGESVTLTVNKEERSATVIAPDGAVVESDAESGDHYYYFQLDQPDFSLTNGDKATVTAIIDTRVGVLYLPDSAIRTVQEKPAVYYENEDGIRDLKMIETGLKAERKVEIVSGLQEGETIIIG